MSDEDLEAIQLMQKEFTRHSGTNIWGQEFPRNRKTHQLDGTPVAKPQWRKTGTKETTTSIGKSATSSGPSLYVIETRNNGCKNEVTPAAPATPDLKFDGHCHPWTEKGIGSRIYPNYLASPDDAESNTSVNMTQQAFHLAATTRSVEDMRESDKEAWSKLSYRQRLAYKSTPHHVESFVQAPAPEKPQDSSPPENTWLHTREEVIQGKDKAVTRMLLRNPNPGAPVHPLPEGRDFVHATDLGHTDWPAFPPVGSPIYPSSEEWRAILAKRRGKAE